MLADREKVTVSVSLDERLSHYCMNVFSQTMLIERILGFYNLKQFLNSVQENFERTTLND